MGVGLELVQFIVHKAVYVCGRSFSGACSAMFLMLFLFGRVNPLAYSTLNIKIVTTSILQILVHTFRPYLSVSPVNLHRMVLICKKEFQYYSEKKVENSSHFMLKRTVCSSCSFRHPTKFLCHNLSRISLTTESNRTNVHALAITVMRSRYFVKCSREVALSKMLV